ncbi:Na/Pi cotransporter family protein [Roseivirga sp.]|uniref:Na/Pi cotransporter family protein n=1 Tax=Roseivirga sp. TaxID=1964215 RepID=UPI003B52A039
MTESVDIWKLAAGLGLFLFGMSQLETGVKELAGRGFKIFIKKHTKNKLKAIFGGTVITAILQSSSVVSLMLLAFVGAGVIRMKSALGVIIGSNLGTTFTGWLVTTLGFKMDIQNFVMPFIAIGAVLTVLFPKKKTIFNSGLLVLGMAFLFLGLDLMKESVLELAESFDVSRFTDYPPVVFLLVGFVFTAIIQSSSASMVITLSALHAGIIGFDSGVAMVIGSDLGTTITVLLGSIAGTAAKKRVAMGHFLFNLVTDIIAFAFMKWFILLVTDVFGVNDPLFGLVILHSSFNILGILIFLPFIDNFAGFLEKRFKREDDMASKFIHQTTVELPEAALESLKKEVNHLIVLVVGLYRSMLISGNNHDQPLSAVALRRKSVLPFKDQYNRIKRLQGEMVNFYSDLQKQELSEQESSLLSLLMSATGNCLFAAKGIKDIESDMDTFRRSSRSAMNMLYNHLSSSGKTMVDRFDELLKSGHEHTYFEELGDQLILIQRNYNALLSMVYDRSNRKHLEEVDIATALNVNRELYASNKAIIMALKDYLLNREQAIEFESLPAYR